MDMRQVRTIQTLVFGSLLLANACTSRAAGEGGDDAPTETAASADESAGACEPITQSSGAPSGFEWCPDSDSTLRVTAESCEDPFPDYVDGSCQAGYGTCSTDDDCTEKPYGGCRYVPMLGNMCSCFYGCVDDSECGDGYACLCSPLEGGTACIEAECKTDADCSGGERCKLTADPDGWFKPYLRCEMLN